MAPYVSYLVFGTVLNSIGNLISNSNLEVITSIGRKNYTTNASGLYLYDLAEIGYSDGETVTVNVTEPFNNEFKVHSYVVEGDFNEENITTQLRTYTENITDYPIKSVLHSVGKSPITNENPLSVETVDSNGNNTSNQYTVSQSYGSNGLIEFIGRTSPGTNKSNDKWQIKKLTYDGRKITDIQFAGGTNAFNQIWNNRSNLSYS